MNSIGENMRDSNFCVNELSKIRWKEKESSTFSSTQRQHPVRKILIAIILFICFPLQFSYWNWMYIICILISVFGLYNTQLYVPTTVVWYELAVKTSTCNLSAFIFDTIAKIRILKNETIEYIRLKAYH